MPFDLKQKLKKLKVQLYQNCIMHKINKRYTHGKIYDASLVKTQSCVAQIDASLSELFVANKKKSSIWKHDAEAWQ